MDKENKILIASSTKNLSKVRDFVSNIAELSGIAPDVVNQITLAVDEACTNIIKYSHKYDETKYIEIETHANRHKFAIKISYKGEGFNPNNVPTPNMIEYFKNYKRGGLGIPMIRKFITKIEYKHSNPDNNLLTLIRVL